MFKRQQAFIPSHQKYCSEQLYSSRAAPCVPETKLQVESKAPDGFCVKIKGGAWQLIPTQAELLNPYITCMNVRI